LDGPSSSNHVESRGAGTGQTATVSPSTMAGAEDGANLVRRVQTLLPMIVRGLWAVTSGRHPRTLTYDTVVPVAYSWPRRSLLEPGSARRRGGARDDLLVGGLLSQLLAKGSAPSPAATGRMVDLIVKGRRRERATLRLGSILRRRSARGGTIHPRLPRKPRITRKLSLVMRVVSDARSGRRRPRPVERSSNSQLARDALEARTREYAREGRSPRTPSAGTGQTGPTSWSSATSTAARRCRRTPRP